MERNTYTNPSTNEIYHQFLGSDIYVQPYEKEEKYVYKHPKLNLHWGQRKLGLALIQFLTFYWDPKSIPNPIVVYAGAAPGTNIKFVSQLFPAITWELYDPSKFNVSSNDKIHVHNDYFTDDVAKQWSDRNDVFFISDIRGSIEKGLSKKQENELWEQVIRKDMENQSRWYKIIKPVKAQLKFRLPYTVDDNQNIVEYLKGTIYKGIWAPPHSTEGRLVPEGYDEMIYDARSYEYKQFYFNINIRSMQKYINPFYAIGSGYEFNDIGAPELLNDWDSLSETYIWMWYIQKMSGNEAITLENIISLERLLTKALNKSGSKLSLESIRIKFLRSNKLL